MSMDWACCTIIFVLLSVLACLTILIILFLCRKLRLSLCIHLVVVAVLRGH